MTDDLSELEPREVLLVWIGRLGDFLTSTPFLAAARRRWPRARITLLTGHKGREAAKLCPDADRLWSIHPFWRPVENARAVSTLLRARFDLAVDLNPSYSRDSGALTRLSRAPVRLSFEKKRAGLFYTHTVPHDPRKDNMVLSYGALAARLGAPYKPVPRVSLLPEHRAEALRALAATGADPAKTWLAVHPGNFSKVRNRWPEAKFVELSRRLPETLELFYIAGPGEEQRVRAMLRELPRARLLPPLPLAASAAALAEMDLLLANSTGTMHLAAAAGTPTFTLFSRYTSLVWSLPEGPHGGVVAEEWTDCRGIPVEKAYEGLLAALAAVPARPRTFS